MMSQFSISPPAVPNVLVSFPVPHVLLVTLNRPKQLNAIPRHQHAALEALYQWYDDEPSLRCAVLTGTGRAFCAGADLKEWNERNSDKDTGAAASSHSAVKWVGGFGGLSNRTGKKPVIAAVNGLCLGGGMEMAINADLIVASPSARFGLPEVSRGVIALAGALPRLQKTVGKQRAAEMALTGRTYDAPTMERWGLVNTIVRDGEDVVAEALKVAGEIAGNSPDSVILSKEGLRLGWEGMGPELATEIIEKGLFKQLETGENMKEGVKSFVERRKPVWTNSKI